MLKSRQIDKSTIDFDTFSVNLYENAISLYIRTNLRLIQLQREVQHEDVNLPKIYKKVLITSDQLILNHRFI